MSVSRFNHSGNAKNDDLLFPSLLPSMLSCLKGSSENQTVSRSQYCVVVCKSFYNDYFTDFERERKLCFHVRFALIDFVVVLQNPRFFS